MASWESGTSNELGIMPLITCNKVDFPHPLGPSSNTLSPGDTENETSLNTSAPSPGNFKRKLMTSTLFCWSVMVDILYYFVFIKSYSSASTGEVRYAPLLVS